MPIREYNCLDCDMDFDHLEFAGDTSAPQCIHCQSLKVRRMISAPGGYAIMGANSASVKPKNSGSFKGRAKKVEG